MKKRKVVVVLMMVVLCAVGCTKKDMNTETQYTGMQTSTQITEMKDTSAQVSTQVTESFASLSTAEKMQNLIVNGHELGMPCQFGEFKKCFKIKDGYTVEPYPYFAIFPYEYNGLKAGEIYVYCSENTDNVKDTDWVCIMTIEMFDFIEETGMTFEFCNINEKSTMEEIIANIGEPSRKTTEAVYLDYYDDSDIETEIFCRDTISFYFGTENKLEDCTLFYNINKLKNK